MRDAEFSQEFSEPVLVGLGPTAGPVLVGLGPTAGPSSENPGNDLGDRKSLNHDRYHLSIKTTLPIVLWFSSNSQLPES